MKAPLFCFNKHNKIEKNENPIHSSNSSYSSFAFNSSLHMISQSLPKAFKKSTSSKSVISTSIYFKFLLRLHSPLMLQSAPFKSSLVNFGKSLNSFQSQSSQVMAPKSSDSKVLGSFVGNFSIPEAIKEVKYSQSLSTSSHA